MSSGHNTNRGRNGNNGGSGSSGGNNRRARRMLSHQRNPATQSVLQRRTDSAPASSSARVSEVSDSLEQEESLPTEPTDADRMDPISHRGEAPLGVPVVPAPSLAGDATNGDEDPPSETVSGQQRANRRSPQLIPSSPLASSGANAARDSAATLNSIRAPFAPGHSHLHSANNLRPASPPAVGDRTVSSGRSSAAVPLRPREEGVSQFSDSSWDATPEKQVHEDGGNEWSRSSTTAPGRTGNPSRDVANHQEQGASAGPAFIASRDVRGDIGDLIDALHEAFERDRGIASQGDSTRCGICYLHYFLSELQYREEEGYYVCASCARALSHTRILMVRRQQRL